MCARERVHAEHVCVCAVHVCMLVCAVHTIIRIFMGNNLCSFCTLSPLLLLLSATSVLHSGMLYKENATAEAQAMAYQNSNCLL